MNLERIKNRFLRLDTYSKMLILASFVTVISVFMPWYEDLDAFKTGDMFLGLTGPLYLAGYVILLSSAFSLSLVTLTLLEKTPPRLPMKSNHIHIASAVLNIFLLVLVHSVYFHDKFGVNIALKESRFGMTLAFFASVTLLIVSVLAERKKGVSLDFDNGKLEPLIKMDSHTRDQRDLESNKLPGSEPAHISHRAPMSKVNHEIRNGVLETVKKEPSTESKINNQPWRMDL